MKLRTIFVIVISLIISLIAINSCSLPLELQKLEELKVFKISNDKQSIVLDGVINSSAFIAFKKITNEYPNVKNLEIVNCEGSINDDVNLELAKYVHSQGFNTHLNDDGIIASGGTDLFLAGIKRSLGKSIKIGVHSWGDGKNTQATDFPKGHKSHKPYIEYYQSIGFTLEESEDFYFFTINSAPASSMHWMTVEEIKKYKMITTDSPIDVYEYPHIEMSSDIPETLSNEIIGKWKLQVLRIGGELASPKEALDTYEVYQNYEKNNKFTSIVGEESSKGTWQFSKAKNSISIIVNGTTSIFKVVYFKNNKMTLVDNVDGQEIIFNYKK